MTNNIDKTLLYFSLSQLSFLTFREKLILERNCRTIDDFLLLKTEDISYMINRRLKTKSFDAHKIFAQSQKSYSVCKAYDIKWVLYYEYDYPAMLTVCYNRPLMMFYRGNIKVIEKRCVSIVGTRQCSKFGALATMDFAYKASENDMCIVSGLALGVDSYSHKGAIRAALDHNITSGVTCAVLPCGVDIITPCINKSLAKRILDTNGAIISQYIPCSLPIEYRFIERNNIISALSSATVVMQAPDGSGALITANLALDNNRYLFFHVACFDDAAREINKQKLASLTEEQKKLPKYSRKVSNYVDSGAPLVNNFEQFLELLNSKY